MACVYILRCADGSYYVGSTRHLERRLWEHNHSNVGATYTRRRRPVVLVWSHEREHVGEAYALEKQIQNWSRAKREALIEGRFRDLPALARGRSGRPVSGAGGVVSTGSTGEALLVSTGSTDEAPLVSTGSTDEALLVSTGSTNEAPLVSTGSTDDRGPRWSGWYG